MRLDTFWEKGGGEERRKKVLIKTICLEIPPKTTQLHSFKNVVRILGQEKGKNRAFLCIKSLKYIIKQGLYYIHPDNLREKSIKIEAF